MKPLDLEEYKEQIAHEIMNRRRKYAKILNGMLLNSSEKERVELLAIVSNGINNTKEKNGIDMG